MTSDWQLVIDAREPHELADFWAAALAAICHPDDADERRARVLAEVRAQGSHHVTMADPEGNEFDVQ